MTKEKRKRLLCKQHRDLLHLILRFGNGAMLLPQLRGLCLTLGLYTNGQAVNRAVRDLKESDILTRQTWIDNNSDLILCRKYVYCFFSGKTRSEVATPHRPNTMAPYILQARKVGWLLSKMDKHSLSRLESVEKYITTCGCTMFLRLPDLLSYYKRYAVLWAKDSGTVDAVGSQCGAAQLPCPRQFAVCNILCAGNHHVRKKSPSGTIHYRNKCERKNRGFCSLCRQRNVSEKNSRLGY